jgi:Tol biopolymer transport system component
MKIKVIIILIFCLWMLSVISNSFAKEIYILKKATAVTDGSLYFMNPRWSPDGKKLALTETKHKGIWVLDLLSGDFIQVTDEVGAGFGFRWSRDSKEILCRVSKQDNYRRYHTLKIFNLETNKVQQLTDYRTLMTGLPNWFEGDRKVYLASNKGLEIFEVEDRAKLNKANITTHKQKICYANEYGFNIHESDGSVSTTTLVEGQVLNAEISPDGNNIAFEILGGNMYVLDLKTKKTKDLGIGYFPQWSPDSKKLVYMITEDDGYQFTKSDIFVININGTGKKNLTNSKDRLEQHPSWAPDGKKIAFDELNSGKIFVIEIAEKKSALKLERKN